MKRTWTIALFFALCVVLPFAAFVGCKKKAAEPAVGSTSNCISASGATNLERSLPIAK